MGARRSTSPWTKCPVRLVLAVAVQDAALPARDVVVPEVLAVRALQFRQSLVQALLPVQAVKVVQEVLARAAEAVAVAAVVALAAVAVVEAAQPLQFRAWKSSICCWLPAWM